MDSIDLGHQQAPGRAIETRQPFAVVGPVTAVSPLVADSPHSWRQWPGEGTRTVATPAQLDTAWDAWVDEIWSEALDGGAPLLAARFHRAYIDPNRSRDDIDIEMLDGEWPGAAEPGAKTRAGMGLIRRYIQPGSPMYAQPLPVAEVLGRIARCYDPYHARLDALVEAALAAHGFSVHLNCHSMKAVGNAMNEDSGTPRPDIVVGDRDGRSASPRLIDWTVEHLRALGYSVGINSPYRGAELVRRHGRPELGRHSLQIEIKRTLYMDEARCERHAGFGHLIADLALFVRSLRTALAGELVHFLRPNNQVPNPPTRSESP